MPMNYTESEKQKKYTVQDAINAAKVRIDNFQIALVFHKADDIHNLKAVKVFH